MTVATDACDVCDSQKIRIKKSSGGITSGQFTERYACAMVVSRSDIQRMTQTTYRIVDGRGIIEITTDATRAGRLSRAGYRVTAHTAD
jgi:hypothetical protein